MASIRQVMGGENVREFAEISVDSQPLLSVDGDKRMITYLRIKID